MDIKEKLRALANAVSDIEKQFGEGSVMYLGKAPRGVDIPSFSTGSIGLDRAIGSFGYPQGRLIEIYGPESSGKTTLTLHAIAEVQKQGGLCAFIDAEHALDVTYANQLGVDVNNLLVSQPDHGEQALEITDTLVSSGGVDLVVIDSVAALAPKAEIEGEMGDHHVGLQARMMAKAMRKLTAVTHRTGSTIIFINQTRQKIGVTFGSSETTTGGNALKFFATLRLDIRRIGKIKEKDNIVGNQTRVKIVKNKLAPPFREVKFEILFGKGINSFGEVFDMAVDENIIIKSGSHYSLDGARIAHGREKGIAYLVENSNVFESIVEKLKNPEQEKEEEKSSKKSGKAA